MAQVKLPERRPEDYVVRFRGLKFHVGEDPDTMEPVLDLHVPIVRQDTKAIVKAFEESGLKESQIEEIMRVAWKFSLCNVLMAKMDL